MAPDHPRPGPGNGSGTSGDRPPRFLATALSVRSAEVDRVRRLVAASFVLGLALVLFYSAANAIFLTRYDVSVLPWVYIVNAVLVIAVGVSYAGWSARVPTDRALTALSAVMSLSIGLLWVWARWSDDRVVAFMLAVWFRMLFIFAVLGLWEIASTLFDIRQAKRLFPAIALGIMLAFVVGGIATPALGALLAPVDFVGVAALCFMLYTVCFRELLERYGVGAGPSSDQVAPAGPRQILADSYSRRMVWMKTVTILLLYVTEYAFYQQAAATFRTEASLASFLGVFMGGMTVLMVVVTGLLSGRYITRFGIRTATLTLPAGMLAVSLFTGSYGVLAGVDIVFFALVCLTLATDHVLGNAITDPAGAVLFQPMSPVHRMRVRLAVDGWLGSVALVLAGSLLLVFQAVDLGSVAPYLFLVAAIAAVGVWVAILQHQGYVAALHSSTTLGFHGDGGLGPVVAGGPAGPGGVGADEVGIVLAAASLARATAGDPLGPLLPALVEHPSADVVELALRAIGGSGDPAGAALAQHAADRADLPVATRSRALGVLAVLDPEAGRRAVSDRLASAAPASALAPALSDPSSQADALELLGALSRSSRAVDRELAAEALAASRPGLVGEDGVVAALLHDPDPAVVGAALRAAEGRVTEDIVPALLDHAARPDLRWSALRALATAGPACTGQVIAVLAELSDDLACDLVRVLAPAMEPASIVGRFLTAGSPSVVRCAGYEALALTGRGGAVRHLLQEDLERLEVLRGHHAALGPAVPLVACALEEEFELARSCVYAALGVEYGLHRLRDIEALVRRGDADDRANAIEALDIVLAPDHRRPIITALEPIDLAEAAARAPTRRGADPVPAGTRLHQLQDAGWLTAWSRRVVALQLGKVAGEAREDGARDVDPLITRVLSLKAVDIFSTLSFDTLTELASLVRTEVAAPGSVVIAAGALGEELYALTSGVVEVTTRDGHVRRLEAGTAFGEISILDPAPRSSTVTAVTEVELLVVPRTAVLALADRRPAVMVEIARVLARRLRSRG